MKNFRNFTAIMEKEDDSYVALCPEIDVASHGAAVKEARNNLQEAIGLFLENASKEEIASGLRNIFFITNMQIAFW